MTKEKIGKFNSIKIGNVCTANGTIKNVKRQLTEWEKIFGTYDKGVTSRIFEEFLQFSSVAQSCLTLCDPMHCSTRGFPIHHQLPELTQTHVHQVSDAIQSSHPVWSSSPPAFSLAQHHRLF